MPLEFLQSFKSCCWPRLAGPAVGLKVADKAQRSILIHLGHSLCHQSLSMRDVCVAAQGRCLTPRALEMFLEKALFARCLWKPSSRHSREQATPWLGQKCSLSGKRQDCASKTYRNFIPPSRLNSTMLLNLLSLLSFPFVVSLWSKAWGEF